MLPFLLDDAHFGAKMLKKSRNCAKSCGKNPQNKSEKIPKLARGPPTHPTIRSQDFFLTPWPEMKLTHYANVIFHTIHTIL